MPILSPNHILNGLSGKLGNLVLRQFRGKTVVQGLPVRKVPFRPWELTNQERFKKAMAYAKEARHNKLLWAMYAAEGKRRGGTSNAFAVAVADYMGGCRLRTAQMPAKRRTNRSSIAVKGKPAAGLRLKTATRTNRPSGRGFEVLGLSGFGQPGRGVVAPELPLPAQALTGKPPAKPWFNKPPAAGGTGFGNGNLRVEASTKAFEWQGSENCTPERLGCRYGAALPAG